MAVVYMTSNNNHFGLQWTNFTCNPFVSYQLIY